MGDRMRKKRDSKFELLRILSMIMIISSHFSLYGNWQNKNSNIIKTMQFQPWGQIGVYLFVMISGYFLSTKDLNFKLAWNRVLPLWEKTILYSIFCLFLAFILKLGTVNLKSIIKGVFPISFNQYWFMTSFIVLMLITPLLNYLVNNFNKGTLQFSLLGIILIADIYPLFGNSPLGGTLSASVLISAYLIAACIRKYEISIKYWISILLIILGLSGQYYSMYLMNVLHQGPLRFTNGILPLISAVGIFLIFLNLPSFYNRSINFLASSVLAAYLITMHQTIYEWFWQTFLNVGKFQASPWLTFIGLGVSLLIVICCCLVDKIFKFAKVQLSKWKI